MDYRPKPPFTSWARQWMHPAFGLGWLSLNPVFLATQSNFVTANADASNALNDFIDETITRIGVELAARAVVIHDWRSAREFDVGARRAWTERVRSRPAGFAGSALTYIALSAGRVTRMSLQVASLAHQLMTGQPPIRIISDPAGPLRQHGFGVPSLGTAPAWKAHP